MKLAASMVEVLCMFREVLREIFDESAYQRFLAEYGLASSAGAYEEFCRSREQWKLRRPRCC